MELSPLLRTMKSPEMERKWMIPTENDRDAGGGEDAGGGDDDGGDTAVTVTATVTATDTATATVMATDTATVTATDMGGGARNEFASSNDVFPTR
ncbi:hypothetical protein QR680_009977 [Steinernema hermaphroditum]|uniref:Uncharacterized protein n=1 Tax=Steinernema hermaphroditum TaxID=289476 RepID=A0AA39IMA5_9BILA|nr:hypothetical protein QR680_009977 [Steinernema hermaphroditum]